MKKFHFTETSLFWGFSEEEAESILKCLSAVNKTYKKDEYIFRMGDTITSVGMVLTGSVQVIREDYWGGGASLDGLFHGMPVPFQGDTEPAEGHSGKKSDSDD